METPHTNARSSPRPRVGCVETPHTKCGAPTPQTGDWCVVSTHHKAGLESRVWKLHTPNPGVGAPPCGVCKLHTHLQPRLVVCAFSTPTARSVSSALWCVETPHTNTPSSALRCAETPHTNPRRGSSALWCVETPHTNLRSGSSEIPHTNSRRGSSALRSHTNPLGGAPGLHDKL